MTRSIVLCVLFAMACAAGEPSSPSENAAGLKHRATIEVKGDYRFISSNGIPDHAPGQFPNPGNPNTMTEQKYEFRVPVYPKPTEVVRRQGPVLFGVALNGVPFDPGTAELWNGNFQWRYEAVTGGINLGLDANNAHVQPGGKYHYHALPTGLIDRISVDKQKMVLVGYAADGYPIYSQYGYNDPQDPKSGVRKMKASYKIKDGERPAGAPPGKYDGRFAADWEYVKGMGDLDECNGRFGITAEYPEGTFHYYITEECPFIPRLFKGEPDPSFMKRDGPPRGRPGFGPPPGGPGFGPPRGGPGPGGAGPDDGGPPGGGGPGGPGGGGPEGGGDGNGPRGRGPGGPGPDGPGGPGGGGSPGRGDGNVGGPGSQPPPLEQRNASTEKPDPDKLLERAAKLMEEAKKLTEEAAKLKAQKTQNAPVQPAQKKSKPGEPQDE